MEHYFSKKTETSFRRESFVANVLGYNIKINSGNSIFSLKELDFGTKLLIENAKIPIGDTKILDLGCGYGVIGIAMKLHYPDSQVTMSDINERATWMTKENCRQNKAEALIIKSDIFSNPVIAAKKFDVVLTNPPFSAGKNMCIEFVKQSFEHLNAGGSLQVVAPHNKGGESLKKFMLELFGNVDELAKKSGYRVYISEKK
jgi:16S rRNA G1207 methylase RsmC